MFQIRIILYVIFLIVFASPLFAGTYYVDSNGGSTWANCEHNAAPSGAKSGSNACSVKTANANAVAGDTIYIRGGSYTIDDTFAGANPGINPANSGTAGNPITYIIYGDETALFTGDGTMNRSHAVYIRERSYIRVSGLDFTLCNTFLTIDGRQRQNPFKDVGANYNIIDNCTFRQVRYNDNDGSTAAWRGSTIYHNASHNWVHDCTFQAYGAFTPTQDVGVLFELGLGTTSTDQSNYNTIENNHMYQAGHHVLGINTGRYTVVRNNYTHNEGWYAGPGCEGFENGVCGYRVVSMTGAIEYSGYALLEDNRIAYGAYNGGPHLATGASGSGLTIGTPYNIVRYNEFYANALFGARFGSSLSPQLASYNRVYNNTFYHNGYGADDDYKAIDSYRGGLSFYISNCSAVQGNVVKNNIFYDQWAEKNKKSGTLYYPAIFTVNASVDACNTVENNHVDGATYNKYGTPWTGSADPLFTDPTIDDPSDTSKPDLSLQSGSPCIDTGTYLTQANSSGSSSTSLTVDDARYFQDGSWGSDLARSTLHADWIAIGTLDNIAQISSINYDTNTINLVSPITWDDNAFIWLNRKSDGERVRYGTAPDMGAHEFFYILPPQNLRIVK
jgi:hypothetical protein